MSTTASNLPRPCRVAIVGATGYGGAELLRHLLVHPHVQVTKLVAKDNTLVISGRLPTESAKAELLYRGIAGRPFERKFVLADHVVVDGADLQNGLLHVALKRVVPEALKPRRIPIGGVTPTAIANDPAATAQAA